MADRDVSGGVRVIDEQDDMKQVIPPPDKKKFEESLEKLTTAIKAKELELHALLATRPDENSSHQVSLRSIRAEKNEVIAERKKVEIELRSVTEQISKQMVAMMKVQATLSYRREDKINEGIRRLEYQLKTQNFKLIEEKRIVAEIDSLNRSKKRLTQYLAIKSEIDGMRDQQREMREAREIQYKKLSRLKGEEDALQKMSFKTRSQCDELKKEIDKLYDEKRLLVTEHHVEEKVYAQQLEQQQRQLQQGECADRMEEPSQLQGECAYGIDDDKAQWEYVRRTEEQKERAEEAYDREIVEQESRRLSHNEEIELCSLLRTYLQRHLTANGGCTAGPTDTSDVSTVPESACLHAASEGMYVLKRCEEDMFTGVARSNKSAKRNKRDKRKQEVSRPLVHSPEIFAQFAQLDLMAPASTSGIANSIADLNAKQDFYHSLSAVEPCVCVEADDSSPSLSESAIWCESMPSTPEINVQSAAPPLFPMSEPRLRRISCDSGNCEDEPVDAAAIGGQQSTTDDS